VVRKQTTDNAAPDWRGHTDGKDNHVHLAGAARRMSSPLFFAFSVHDVIVTTQDNDSPLQARAHFKRSKLAGSGDDGLLKAQLVSALQIGDGSGDEALGATRSGQHQMAVDLEQSKN